MGATRWTWVNGHYRNQNGKRVWVRGHPRRLSGGPGADEVGAGLVAVIGFVLVLGAMIPTSGSPPPEQREPIPVASLPADLPADLPETEPPPEPIESEPPPEPVESEIPPEPTGTGRP
ncbi:hypothetical protein ACSDR0_01920 [Streptosporangium sp. G11]|uniref:hypothetical protein n=1 Tax=Streptosporangium sp. G11 TaxID=3436926 RepID=UPI003EBC1FB0